MCFSVMYFDWPWWIYDLEGLDWTRGTVLTPERTVCIVTVSPCSVRGRLQFTPLQVLSIWLHCHWEFYIWSLIIAEAADQSHRRQSDKQVSEVGTGAAALLLHSCHWYIVGRQLKWAYAAHLHAKSNHARMYAHTHTQAHLFCTQIRVWIISNIWAITHLLFLYILDISAYQPIVCVCVNRLWHGAGQIGPRKEASLKSGRLAQQRLTVIISCWNEFSLGAVNEKMKTLN